jgi:hypothetical protein
LVTAPSNQAADLLLEKLSVNLNRSEMLRFMAFNRHVDQVSQLNIDYSYSYDNRERVFLQPPLDKLLSFKVVIATCCMASKLYNLGVPRGHFGRNMHTYTHYTHCRSDARCRDATKHVFMHMGEVYARQCILALASMSVLASIRPGTGGGERAGTGQRETGGG